MNQVADESGLMAVLLHLFLAKAIPKIPMLLSDVYIKWEKNSELETLQWASTLRSANTGFFKS